MKNATTTTLINGIATEFLSTRDRSIHYGDGLFETILCNNRQLYHWSQHYQRLRSSAERLKIKCPSQGVLLADIKKCLPDSAEAFSVKILLTRGCSERGYSYSKAISSNRVIMVSELAPAYSSLLSRQLLSGDLYLCEQQASINKNLAGLKHLNRLENVLARSEWGAKDSDIIDGLMLNHNDYVIEATMSNVFLIKDDGLFTPDLSLSGIHGIMRQQITELSEKMSIKTTVEDITLDQVLQADELFLSSSLIGMKWIEKFNTKTYKKNTLSNTIFNELLNTIDHDAQTI